MSRPHNHLTIDEDVFHAYQDIASEAERIVDANPSSPLAYGVVKLRAALALFYADATHDPSVTLRTSSDLPPSVGASTSVPEVPDSSGDMTTESA